MTYVKLYGLQRSGTNMVKGLLEINFESVVVLQSILGNKHRPFDRNDALSWQPTELDPRYITMSAEEIADAKESLRTGKMCAVLSIKDPYAWLVSYYKLRKTKNPKYMVWSPTYIRKTLPLWVKANADWMRDLGGEFGSRLVVNFYDENSADARSLLDEMERNFSLTRKGTLVTSLPRATLRGNDSHFGEAIMSDEKFDSDYYLKKRYRKRFPEKYRETAKSILRDAPKSLRRFIVW